jgi:hypothetical protein
MKITKNNINDIFRCKQKSEMVLKSQGYELIQYIFADSSGWGLDSEPALTPNQLLDKISDILNDNPTIYAYILDAGQFQVNIGIYKKTGKKTSKKLANNTYLLDDNKIILHDTVILEQKEENIILNNGGWTTRTTKERINTFLPNQYYISQKDFEWYLHDTKNETVIPYTNGMCIKGYLSI